MTVKRGPLVYSLKIGERWERIRGEDPCPDYAVHPTTPWNYGLLIDPENPEVEVVKKSVGDVVYGPDFAPIELKVKGRKIPEWQMENQLRRPAAAEPGKSERARRGTHPDPLRLRQTADHRVPTAGGLGAGLER